jgi:hypothetical protein
MRVVAVDVTAPKRNDGVVEKVAQRQPRQHDAASRFTETRDAFVSHRGDFAFTLNNDVTA